MPKRARAPELEGTGIDDLPYQVKQDGKATKKGCKYKIYFGRGLRESIRFPPGRELTHENGDRVFLSVTTPHVPTALACSVLVFIACESESYHIGTCL